MQRSRRITIERAEEQDKDLWSLRVLPVLMAVSGIVGLYWDVA